MFPCATECLAYTYYLHDQTIAANKQKAAVLLKDKTMDPIEENQLPSNDGASGEAARAAEMAVEGAVKHGFYIMKSLVKDHEDKIDSLHEENRLQQEEIAWLMSELEQYKASSKSAEESSEAKVKELEASKEQLSIEYEHKLKELKDNNEAINAKNDVLEGKNNALRSQLQSVLSVTGNISISPKPKANAAKRGEGQVGTPTAAVEVDPQDDVAATEGEGQTEGVNDSLMKRIRRNSLLVTLWILMRIHHLK